MKYADARPNIRSGDLLAWSHRSWASLYDWKIQAVRIFTQSEFCHVGTAWVIGGRVFVIEAVMPKVRIYPLSKMLPFWHLTMHAPWKAETEEFALSQVGQPYSQWQAMQAFFGLNPRDELWECAELAHAILESDGITLDVHHTPSAVVYAAQERDGVVTTLVTQ